MMTTSSLTELRQAALALWRRQRQDLERDAARQAAERALDVFGDQAGPLADSDSWQGNADGDATALPALDEDGEDKLEYDHTFDEQLWLRSNCPACGGSGTRITPLGSVLALGQALDGLQEARGTSCDDCDEPSSAARRLYQAVLDASEEAGESEEEAEDELTEGLGRGRG